MRCNTAGGILSKMYSDKNKGFSVLSKFGDGCACAMWAVRSDGTAEPFLAETARPSQLQGFLLEFVVFSGFFTDL